MGLLRMVLRLLAFLAWTLACLAVQFPLMALPGRGKVWVPVLYWRGVARIIGLRRRVVGALARERPVLFVVNHSSWIDIVALGATLPGCFVAKAAIAQWPGFSLVARAGRTIFVSRAKATVARETAALVGRLGAGDNIVLFPEGTTSDGNRVLPFAPAFLALAETAARPWVQPVTLVYDELEGLPVTRADRPEIAWYGDMDIATHFNVIGRRRGFRATIVLHPPVPPGAMGRKALSGFLQQRIAGTAAALRQQCAPEAHEAAIRDS